MLERDLEVIQVSYSIDGSLWQDSWQFALEGHAEVAMGAECLDLPSWKWRGRSILSNQFYRRCIHCQFPGTIYVARFDL